ncbi:MAG: hypothetical protein OXS28_01265 [Gammaproteobacteria bacterium]|nr:hypothetical protein [Gammaproteobacteria bacterium]
MLKSTTIILALALPSVAAAAGFPTVETVRQVVSCMAELGEQSEENLLTCACRQDVIEAGISFEVFEQASLQERYNRMPGKRGGLFRDDEISREQLKQLKAIRKQALASCPAVKKVKRAEESK